MIPGAQMLFGSDDAVSAKSYVQRGLIGMWDAVENIGFGQHSGNTLLWKNLGSLGSAYDATRIDQAQAWTENGAVFRFGSTAYVFEIPGYFMRDEMGSEWSYELVFTPGEKWVQCTPYSGIFGNHGSNKGIVGGQCDGNNSTVAFNLYTPAIQIWNPVISENFSLGQIASVSEAASNASQSATAWKNGQIVNSTSNADVEITFDREGTYIGSAFFGRDPSQGWRTFDGTIHCVRVYDRPITSSEVEKNHQIDVKRFGGFA